MKAVDFTGRRFGRLVVTALAERQDGITTWHCLCDCGTPITVRHANLKSGCTTSCGCFRKQVTGDTHRIHGASRTPAHAIWMDMRRRCRSHPNYAGRGITVCDRWSKFEDFHADMGDPPPGMTIDRLDNDGDYEPGNCRWATYQQQADNRRNTVWLTLCGERLLLADACAKYGVDRRSVYNRVQYNRISYIEAFLEAMERGP